MRLIIYDYLIICPEIEIFIFFDLTFFYKYIQLISKICNLQAYYWNLPAQFIGNKLDSYGGVLNFTLRHSPMTTLPQNDKGDREGGSFVQMKVRLYLLLQIKLNHS